MLKIAVLCRIVAVLALSLSWPSVGGAEPHAAVRVTTVPLGERLFYPSLGAPAEVVSLNRSRIPAETAGRLQRIAVRVGERVAAGGLLAELECSDNRLRLQQEQAALDAAGAMLLLAQRQLDRTRALRADRAASEELLNQREAELASARADRSGREASVETVRLAMERCRIVAPFEGVVLERLAGEGEWLVAGTPVVTLLDGGRIELSAQIGLGLVAALERAEGIEFENGGARYPVRLRGLLPSIDSRGRNREARLEFVAEAALPGGSGRLVWRSPFPHLPADLLVRRAGGLGVFLLEGGEARFHPLPEALEGQPVRFDLPPGTRLILDGRHGLADGAAVIDGPAE